MRKGYISDPDVKRPHVETKGRAGVSKTLEYAYDDYSLAQLAADLGQKERAEELMVRSGNYRNVFDTDSRFMRGRHENGEWIHPFNPQYPRSEEHTSELQSLMRISSAVLCLKKTKKSKIL